MARPPGSGPSGPPISFKTVPGRHRTQKWNVAKQYDYSGDDWGGYDAYDDYGGDDDPAPQQSAPSAPLPPSNYATQLPSQQQKPERQMSFDQAEGAEEARQFSRGPLLHGGTSGERSGGVSPARSAVSAASSGGKSSGGKRSGEFQPPPGARPRDFTNPEQVPAPLSTGARASPALSSSSFNGPAAASPSTAGNNTAAFPPRKSSASNGSPAPDVPPSAAKVEKELPTPPFIRPSDIYKRMAAEREKERQSSDGGRPSLDALQHDTPPHTNLTMTPRQQRPLSAVEEGQTESPQDIVSGSRGFNEPASSTSPSSLPQVRGVSVFGNDWFAGQSSSSMEPTPVPPITAATDAASPTSILSTPTVSNAPASSDPAAEILAERTHQTPVSAIGRQIQPDDLAHQPSQGYRSVVNRAFDHGATSDSTPPTRDNSQSTTGVSRSGSESTGGISPIMSRVPYPSIADTTQQGRDNSVPTIAEEPSRGLSAETSPRVSRKATPSHSRTGSSEREAVVAGVGAAAVGAAAAAGVVGYRRSFDPPESDNSPAHTPMVQSSDANRLSDGLAAETSTSSSAAEAAAGSNKIVEPLPPLNTAELPAGEILQPHTFTPSSSALPQTGRSRAGTDYSMRESDIADAVNNNNPSSPDQPTMSPTEAAREEKAEQNLFLRTHTGTPTNTGATAAVFEGQRTTSPASGRGSPAKGRVREIAEKYQDLHESSRRNSQTSLKSTSTWSRVDSEENLSTVDNPKEEGSAAPWTAEMPKRQGTGSTWASSNIASESEYSTHHEEEGVAAAVGAGAVGAVAAGAIAGSHSTRPGMERDQSFRPQLPGGWVSYRDGAPSTPSGNEGETLPATVYDQSTPRASNENQESALEAVDFTPTTRKVPLEGSHLPDQSSHLDQAKEAGNALGAAILTSVGMGHQTRDFGSSGPAQPVDNPEMRPKPSTGDLNFLRTPQRPELNRGDTEATDVTDIASAASSVPPTPPAKDTDRSLPGASGDGYYFTGAPLQTGRSREGSPDRTDATTPGSAPRPGVSPAMSTWVRPSDTESDRLRKEIVKSLDSAQMEKKMQEDTERTQDALDAPVNAERVDKGKGAIAPAEMKGGKPGMLGKRFSWEQDEEEDAPVDAGMGFIEPARPSVDDKQLPAPPPPIVMEPQQESSPEIKPEMPYERPRSRGLHIMNADGDSSDEEDRQASAGPASLGVFGAPPVSPLTKSQENLRLANIADTTREGGTGVSAPSPVSDEGEGSVRLPSYYMLDVPGLEGSKLREKDSAETAPEVTNAAEDTSAVEGGIAELPAQRFSVVPQPPAKDVASLSSPSSPTGKQKIPPFREILAIKSTPDRIRTYDETRQTFADTDTGLSDWLSGMLAQHPEHADLSTSSPTLHTPLGNMKAAHKSSPSLAKFTRNFSGAGLAGPSQPGEPSGADPKTPSKDFGDMDELKQRGKDLMKNASVLGGKAQAGAKGLLAKGKSRFGSTRESRSKDLSSSSAPASRSVTREPPLPRVLDRSDPDHLVQPMPQRLSTSVGGSPLVAPAAVPPVPRDHTQTPSSVYSDRGNPISRTLSRLRDRSRSKSRSRRGSRPTSLVLVRSELDSVQDASPGAVRTADEAIDATTPSVVSPWTEPDAVFPPHEEESAALPERLGVLPSPTTTNFSYMVDSPPRTAESSRDVGTGVRPLDTALSEYQHERARDIDADAAAAAILPVEERAAESHAAAAAVAGSETSAPRPGEEPEEELYESTPVASRKSTFDEPDADQTTPKALQREWQGSTEPLVQDRTIDTVPTHEANIDGEETGAKEVLPEAENVEDVSPHPENPIASDDGDNTGSVAVPDVPSKSEARGTPNFLAVDKRGMSAGSSRYDDAEESEISAEDHNDTMATTADEAANDEASRRSSVSSLGEREPASTDRTIPDPEHTSTDRVILDSEPVSTDRTIPDSEHPIMSSQAVPAGPIGTVTSIAKEEIAPAASSEDKPDFMQRSYLTRPEVPRPLSYEPGERDSTGVVQETLNTSNQQTRDEEEDWRASTAFNTTTLTRHRKQSLPTGDRRSKRFSGFWGERDSMSQARPEDQSPSQMQAERTFNDRPVDIVSPPLQPEIPQRDDNQARRKSGIWDAFKRNSMISNTDSARQSDVQPATRELNDSARMPPPAVAPAPRRREEKPQRVSSVATEPEKKKKRLSGLSSLFGRSSTTGHKQDSPKKLSKASKSRNEPPPSRPARPQPDLSDDDEVVLPPGGWYGPLDNVDHQGNWQRYPPPQQFYQPPSGVFGDSARFSHIPEAFRPVDASYQRPIKPIGPPEPYQSRGMYSQGNNHIGVDTNWHQGYYQPSQPYSEDRFAAVVPGQRQASYGDELSPQISGRSDWLRGDWQTSGSMPSISPIQTRPGAEVSPITGRTRLGSVDEEAGYGNQAQSGGAPNSSRTSYWARQRRARPDQTGNYSQGEDYSYLPPLDMGRPAEEFGSVPRALDGSAPTQYGQAISSDVAVFGSNARLRGQAGTTPTGVQGQQTQSGFAGRGNKFGVEQGEMRGVSYPGQEWTPGQWN